MYRATSGFTIEHYSCSRAGGPWQLVSFLVVSGSRFIGTRRGKTEIGFRSDVGD